MCRILYNKKGSIIGAQALNGKPSKLFTDLKNTERTIKEVETSYLRAFTPEFESSPNSILESVDLNGEPTLHAINTFEMLLREVSVSPVVEQIEEIEKEEEDTVQDLTKLDQKMNGFLKMIGVDLRLVDEIEDNPDVIARANIARAIIEVVKDSKKVDTLPEESAHMLVDILEALSKSSKASPELKSLYRDLVRKTKSSEEYRKMTDSRHPSYDSTYFDKYSEQYEGEQLDNLLLKESMVKNIATHILRREEGGALESTKADISFWEKALNSFFELWNKIVRSMYSLDPYTRAADIMFNEEYAEALKITREIKTAMKDTDAAGVSFEDTFMFQLEEDASKHANTLDKLKETRESFESKRVLAEKYGIKQKWIVEPGEDSVERYVGLPGTKYEGTVVKGRVSDEVKKYFYKKQSRYKQIETQEERDIKDSVAKIRMETGTAGHLTIQEIIEHRTLSKKDGGLSAIQKRSPFDVKQFDIISKEVDKILKAAQAVQTKINKDGKFTVIAEQLVHNPDKKYAGTIDLLVVYSDNTADIYDWKFVSPAMKRGDRGYVEKTSKGFNLVEDPFLVKMDTYHIQLSAYKKTLLDHYGITQVRKSRIVPIHIRYKYDKNKKMITAKVDTIQMGSDMSVYLEQIPVADEMTDYDSLNKVLKTQIYRRENIKRKMQDSKGAERDTLNDRLKVINMAIRKLQVKQDLGYVLTEANKALKKAEKKVSIDERRKADGSINPDYLSNRELLDLYEDLKFYETLLKLEEFKEDKEFNKKIFEIKKAVGPIINSMATTIEQKLVQRGEEVAANQGVRGLRTFNTQIGFGTSNLVSLSKQSNPFMRTLWETMDSVRILKNRSTKALAEEIYDKQEAILAWGENNGYSGVKVYDKILNEETGTLWAKYSAEFWSLRKKALESDDHKWMQANYEIDEDYYKKEFAKWRKNAYTRVEKTYEKSEWTKQKLLWDKKYDVKNQFKTASINNGGIYFLKVKEESTQKYMTSEYREIQNTPELKDFYDFHIQKVREFSDMFGMKLSRGFTANVHADMLDVLVQKGFNMNNLTESFFDTLQIREHDVSLGKIDPNTGETIRTIPKMYIAELVDSMGNKDSSLKSKDLGKSLFLLGKAAMEYQYNTEVVDDIMVLETLLTDNLVTEIPRGNTSKILRDVNGKVQEVMKNSNSEMFSDFVNMYLYGQSLKTKDRSKNLFGRDISVNKTLLGLKQYHSTSMLALKAPVALGALGAGMISLQLQAAKGIFITKANLLAAQKALVSADPKMRALVEHLDVYQDDKFGIVGNKLSANYKSKHLTGENWFIMLMSADRAIDAVASAAMSMNYGIDENGKVKRLAELPEGTKSIWETMQFEENPKWKRHAAIDRYTTKIEGLDDKGFRSIRNKIRAVSDKVKGTLSDDDKMRINSILGGRLLLHYKSWLPGIAMERFGRTRYNYILEHFDEGTHNTFWSNFGADISPEQALDQEVHMHNYLSAIGGDLLRVAADVVTFGTSNSFKIKEGKAKLEFEKFILEQEGNPEFQYETEAEKEELFEKFIDLKRANMRAAVGEIRAVALLMMIIMMMGGDWDDDGKVDIRQTWIGRKLYAVTNRIYRETAVIIDPREFMNSRSTSVPLVSLGTNLINLVANSIDEIRDVTFGENSQSDRSEFGYYTFKFFPGLNGLVKAAEIYSQDKSAKF